MRSARILIASRLRRDTSVVLIPAAQADSARERPTRASATIERAGSDAPVSFSYRSGTSSAGSDGRSGQACTRSTPSIQSLWL